MTKRMILMLLTVSLVLGGIFGWKIFTGMMMKKYMMAGGMPPQTVSTAKVAPQDWQPKLEAVGTVRAINGADLSAEVSGIVQTINFESGADAEKDAVLLKLRDDDDVAKLRSLQATEKLAAITYERDAKQLKVQAISQATVDADMATLDSAKAQTMAQQALVDKKTVKAPFAGRLGIRQADLGQYLQPGATVVTLQQLDPIYVDFTLPEQATPQIGVGQKVNVRTDANPNLAFDGQIVAANSKIDEATRNLTVRASFKNPDHKLLPGMFARVSVEAGQPLHVLTLPQTAIVFNTYGNTVYLVQPKDGAKDDGKGATSLTVQQSVVITGETRGDQIAILSGVKEGDEVVTSGQVKLRSGVPIMINNTVQPTNDSGPTPHEQ